MARTKRTARKKKVGPKKKAKTSDATEAKTAEAPKDNQENNWISEKGNALFEDYYRKVGVVPPEEYDQFFQTLLTALPTTFRVTRTTLFTDLIQDFLVNKMKKTLENITVDGVKIDPPQTLNWCLDSLAWQFDAPRTVLRRSPILEKFHKFLVSLTEQGYISRQEAVSMLPPLFLDVQSHHRVLDMCASPGSKTVQLLEMLHVGLPSDVIPGGVVVANDIDQKRCYTLIHQTNRLVSPNLIVTNHDAQRFPFLKIADLLGEKAASDSETWLEFDRVLCDVPCSGDGTLRKNVDLWKRWLPTLGLGLHNTQLNIAFRGAKLLKVGGRMVYSTCSMNPVEDEAVIAELLRLGGGALKLVDVSSVVPQLRRSKGITHWEVFDRDNSWYKTPDEMPEYRRRKLPPSIFPPTEEEIASFNLDRTFRVLPHHQNTGGFFVAVIEKTAILSAQMKYHQVEVQLSATVLPLTKEEQCAALNEESRNEDAKEGEGKENSEEPDEDTKEQVDESKTETKDNAPKDSNLDPLERPKKKKPFNREAPFLELPESYIPILQSICAFYGIDANKFPFSQLMVRSVTAPTIYFVSSSCIPFLIASRKGILKIVNTGQRIFERHKTCGPTEYRVCWESLRYTLPFITQRVITFPPADFLRLIRVQEPAQSIFSPELRASLNELSQGSAIGMGQLASLGDTRMPVPLWKGNHSIRLFVNKKELKVLRMLLSEDFSFPPTSTSTTTTTTTTAPMAVDTDESTVGKSETNSKESSDQ